MKKDKTHIHWYPGHIAKAEKKLKEQLSLVDAVIEVIDARLPLSSNYDNISGLLNGKPRFLLVNKSDLVDKNELKPFLDYLKNENKISVIATEAKNNKDINIIVKKAKENNIMIEINNSSLSGGSRIGSNVNCEKVALLCKKHGTKVILTSDAHINLKICDFSKSIELLNKIEMPKELIMNEPDKLIAHLKSKGRLQDL